MPKIDYDNLRLWLETEFRAALHDEERLHTSMQMLAIAQAERRGWKIGLQKALAAFVRGLVDPVGEQRELFLRQCDPAARREVAARAVRVAAHYARNWDPIELGA